MRKFEEYKTTTNRRVYNLLHKEVNANCSFCKWHPTFWRGSENQRYKNMHCYEDGNKVGWDESIKHYYNWKLSTKNRKQWMTKKYKAVRKPMYFSYKNAYVYYVEFQW